MLAIRPDQMLSFGRLLRQKFIDAEVMRVRRERPAQAAQASDATIRQFVEHAVERAASYQLVAVGDVQRFIDLFFRLGRSFDEDPAYHEVRRLLEAFEVSGKLRLDRVDRLLAAGTAA